MNEINKKLEDLLSDMNPSSLKLSKQSILELLKTDKGKSIIKKLSQSDRKRIIDTFMRTDNEDIKKKLNDADLMNVSADELLKKLK